MMLNKQQVIKEIERNKKWIADVEKQLAPRKAYLEGLEMTLLAMEEMPVDEVKEPVEEAADIAAGIIVPNQKLQKALTKLEHKKERAEKPKQAGWGELDKSVMTILKEYALKNLAMDTKLIKQKLETGFKIKASSSSIQNYIYRKIKDKKIKRVAYGSYTLVSETNAE